MAAALLLIISKACCFISCECQISAIYIPQLPHAGRMAIDFAGDEWSGRVELKPKRQKGERRRRRRSGGGTERPERKKERRRRRRKIRRQMRL